MPPTHIINVDLARVYEGPTRKELLKVMSWGEEVEVLEIAEGHVRVRAVKFKELEDGSIQPQRIDGFIIPPRGINPADVVLERGASRILKIDFVDVQQGDGSVIETPRGKVVLIDGGDTPMFARYLANRFRRTSAAQPKAIDCILVTHGDADHFAGLSEMHRSETEPRFEARPWKRIFIRPQRVYHNGLVKRPSKRDGRRVPDAELLGATETVEDPQTGQTVTIITGLVDDLRAVELSEMNQPFREWRAALDTYSQRGALECRRLQSGDHSAFDFLADEGIKVQVLGPLPTRINETTGLRFLGEPPAGPRIGQESLQTGGNFRGRSASHTINGHSVIFRLNYGNFNFLFTGDLNDEAGRTLARAHNTGEINLQSEVFKVPHHGSGDFSGAFVQAVAPVVSIISSGDENEQKEYVHPRATMVGALGRYSRVEEPLVFVTEMVAFFKTVGRVEAVQGGQALPPFFAFQRTAFGIVMIRTDGERLLVYTNSGQTDLKEAYAYHINEWGKPEPIAVRQA